jgi:tetratricopeptide (TPR) repeat protein
LAALDPIYAKFNGLIEAFDKSPPPPGTGVSREYLVGWRSSTYGFRDALVDADWKKHGGDRRPNSATGSPLWAELVKIYGQYDVTSQFPRGVPREGPKFEKFQADRREALTRLAASPVAAQSTDYSSLAGLYSQIGRYDDAVNAARAEVDADPTSGEALSSLMQYLTQANRLDEALAAFGRWRTLVVPLVEVETYFRPLKSEIKTMSIALRLVGRDEDADRVMRETREKLNELLALFDKGPAPLKLKRTTISNELTSVADLDSTSLDYAMRQAAKSELRKKIDGIKAKFSPASGRTSAAGPKPGDSAPARGTATPNVEKWQADRTAALAALAAEPETAQSSDLPTLIELYVLVNRSDDALPVFQRWAAAEVAPDEIRKILWAFDAFTPLIKALVLRRRFTEAWQVTVDLEQKLDRVAAVLAARPPTAHSWTFEINRAYSQVRADMQGELAKAEQPIYAAASGPVVLSFSRPLRVSTEFRRIQNVFVGSRDRRSEALKQLAAAAEAARSEEHVELSAVYIGIERYDDAEREIRAALGKDADDIRAHDALLQLLVRSRRTDEAVAAFRSLIAREVAPHRAEEYRRGVASAGATLVDNLAAAGNTPVALQVYRELNALKADENAVGPLLDAAGTLALQLAEKGEHDAALTMFQEHFHPAAGNGALYKFEVTAMLLVNLHAGAGNYAEAQRVLETWRSLIEKWGEASTLSQGTPPPLYDALKTKAEDWRRGFKKPELVGKPYPPIAGATWLTGPALGSKDLDGKVVLIYWSAGLDSRHWGDLQIVNDWEREFGDRGLVVIGVIERQGWDFDPATKQTVRNEGLSPDRRDAAAAALLNELKIRFPVVIDPDRALATAYQVRTIPGAVLVDRNGLVRSVAAGRSDVFRRAIRAGIRQALEPAK